MSTEEKISEINKKYPVNILLDLVEDDKDWQELVIEVLDRNRLKNRRIFGNPEEYETEVERNPDMIPHICIFDNRFRNSGMTGQLLTEMTVRRNRTRAIKTKIIMLSGFDKDNGVQVQKFFHAGGFRWVFKSDSDYKEQLGAHLQDAIESTKTELEEKGLIEETPILETDVLKPISSASDKTVASGKPV